MCGIVGIERHDAREGDALRVVGARLDRLRHRGPDGAQLRRFGRCVLGHARLAIVDPEGGDQPHVSRDGRHALVANGEIYNHEALRAALAGHRFVSGSDTEAALHLLQESGEAGIARLDGMFALAHAGPDGLLLARDPLGIKPLYLARDARGVSFASEMKALQDAPGTLEEVPPGASWTGARGARRYYDVPQPEPDLVDPEGAARALRAALERAVRKRLMSDVPLGAFLSGGLDSSLIAALAVRETGALDTFTVGLEGSSDLLAARAVARHLGTRHHEHVIARAEVEDAMEGIVHALESFDRDLVRSASPTWFTARLAAERVKVVLTGEGADELFAGYRYVRRLRGGALARELRRSLAGMHNVNLQRVDRLTMAHGLEARVPFLDTAVVRLAQRIPPELKLRRVDGRLVEKWILRRAVEDLLPAEVVWRTKAQFDEGTGTAALLEGLAPGGGAGSARFGVTPRSAEEARYLAIFGDVFERPERLAPNVGRWRAPQG